MTAQGEGILAYLEHAIAAREEAAQASVEQATVHLAGAAPSLVGIWHVVDRPATGTFVATSDQWGRIAEVVPTYGGAHADHVALNDPQSVLRRCAADRKLVALHAVVPDHGRFTEGECPPDCDGEHTTPPVCFSCRTYAGDPVQAPCATLRVVAEGYGWTEGE